VARVPIERRAHDEKKLERVTEAFLKMKKFDIAVLERAYLEA
jgi:predicted 3-demethylubiquinone-9 3-methyltransferase (glyoxalase superfamily)